MSIHYTVVRQGKPGLYSFSYITPLSRLFLFSRIRLASAAYFFTGRNKSAVEGKAVSNFQVQSGLRKGSGLVLMSPTKRETAFQTA